MQAHICLAVKQMKLKHDSRILIVHSSTCS